MGPDGLLKHAGLEGSYKVAALLRHHPGRRCTVALTAGETTVVLKAYRAGKGVEHLLCLMAGLHNAGLGGNAGPRPARILGSDMEQSFVVTEWFEAPSGRKLIEAGQGRRAGQLAARWLAGGGLDLRHFPEIPQPKPAGERAARMISIIQSGRPQLADRAAALLEMLNFAVPKGEPVLLHGSFKPGHIFDLGGRPGLIDWESARAGPAELDAGTFLAKLASLRIRHPRLGPELQAARVAFLQCAGGAINRRSVVWYEAFAQLKRATVALGRKGTRAEKTTERLLDEAASLLAVKA